MSVASEFLLTTGRFINADRALRVGIVSQVVAADQLDNCVRAYLEEMLTTSPIGLRLTKECMNMSIDTPSLESEMAVEDRNQILCTQTNDVSKGVSAFLGKWACLHRVLKQAR